MRTLEVSTKKIILELSKDELNVFINALNEVCNTIEPWEFETRMGITTEEAKTMLEFLNFIYSTTEQNGE